MADSLDAFLDGTDDEADPLDAFLDGKEGTMSESRLRGERAAEWLADTPYLGAAASAASGALEGATFGFSDEILGGLGAMLGNGYEDTRDMARQFNTTMGERRPFSNMAGDLAGSIVVPGGAAKLGMRGLDAANTARRAKNLRYDERMYAEAKGWLNNKDGLPDNLNTHLDDLGIKMATGAGAGALRAAGENEKNDEILGDIAQGGALGSLLGGAGQALSHGGKKIGELVDKYEPPASKMVDYIFESTDDIKHPLLNALDKMNDHDPKMLERMVGRLFGPRIDIPGFSVKGAELAGKAAEKVGPMLSRPGAVGPTGALLGAASAEKMDSNDLFLDATKPEPRPAAPQDQPTMGVQMSEYLSNPLALITQASGTQYGPMLEDAMSEGAESLRAKLYVLAQRPEFRRAMGLE